MAGLMNVLVPGSSLPNPESWFGSQAQATPTGPLGAAASSKKLPQDVLDYFAGQAASALSNPSFTGSDGLVYNRLVSSGNGGENDPGGSPTPEGYYATEPGKVNPGDQYNRYNAGGDYVGTMVTPKHDNGMGMLIAGIATALTMGAGGAVMGAMGGAAEGAGAGTAAMGAGAAAPEAGGLGSAFSSLGGIGADVAPDVASLMGPAAAAEGANVAFNAAKDSQLASDQLGITGAQSAADAAAGGIPTVTVNGAPGATRGVSSALDTVKDIANNPFVKPLLQSGITSLVSGLLASKKSSGSSLTSSATTTPAPVSMPDPLAAIRDGQNSIIDQLSRHGRASTILTVKR